MDHSAGQRFIRRAVLSYGWWQADRERRMVELVSWSTIGVGLLRRRDLVVHRPTAARRTVFANVIGGPSFRERYRAFAGCTQSCSAHRSWPFFRGLRVLSNHHSA